MARYAGVEPLSQRFRRKRGAYDGVLFAVSGGRLGIDVRLSRQFAQLGGRRWCCASMARNWIALRSSCWIYWPWWRGQAPADRISRTRQACPPAEYGVAAARFLRCSGSRLARQPRDPAQKSTQGRGKEINRRGGRCASALHARVSGERTRDYSFGGSRRTNGKVPRQLRNEFIGAKQSQSPEMGGNGRQVGYGAWS